MTAPPITRRSRGARVEDLQREIKRTLEGRGFDWFADEVVVDGVPGELTLRNARRAASMQGLPVRALRRISAGTINRRDEKILRREARRSALMLRRDRKRRPAWAEVRKAHNRPTMPTSGVVTFDGRQVAAWIAYWLQKSRDAGWQGYVTSGWRDPAYSESLCLAMCGAPSCPGKCAGRASNHAGSIYPAGAVDVTDYYRFADIQRQIGSPLINTIGPSDPVHFSVSGR